MSTVAFEDSFLRDAAPEERALTLEEWRLLEGYDAATRTYGLAEDHPRAVPHSHGKMVDGRYVPMRDTGDT